MVIKKGLKSLYWFTFLLIPFSLEYTLPGTDAVISFPVEGLTLFISLYFFYKIIQSKVAFEVLLNPIVIIVILDIAWLLVTSILSSDPVVSGKRVAMRINFYIVAFFIPYLASKEKKWLIKPLFLYVIGLVPVVFLVLFKHAKYDFLAKFSYVICRPYYDEHTVYGAAIAFSIPIAILLLWAKSQHGKKWISQTFLFMVIFALFVGLVYAFSRAAWVSLLLGAFVFVLLQLKIKPKIYVIGLLILAIGAYIGKNKINEYLSANTAVSNTGAIYEHATSVTNIQSDASNLERINRWVCAYRMFQDRPLTGFGPGTYQFQYANYQTTEYKTRISTLEGNRGNAHSEYLMYLSETGLPGFIIFILLVLTTCYLGIQNSIRTNGPIRQINNFVLFALVTYFLHGVFNSFIDQDKIALPVFAAMACIASIHQYHQKGIENGD
ncbi:MAG: O-antigen ligase family protein [Bacteroidetes bacterium]|nr:O-antigen ligase family protein [Bacteroidota bacterium]